MLGPASTDAVNRASRLSYGEATGITQTVRNYAASLGLAILGTILVTDCGSGSPARWEQQGFPTGPGAGLASQRPSRGEAAPGRHRRSRTTSGWTSRTRPGRCCT